MKNLFKKRKPILKIRYRTAIIEASDLKELNSQYFEFLSSREEMEIVDRIICNNGMAGSKKLYYMSVTFKSRT